MFFSVSITRLLDVESKRELKLSTKVNMLNVYFQYDHCCRYFTTIFNLIYSLKLKSIEICNDYCK